MTHFAKRFFGQGIPRNGLILEFLFNGNSNDTSDSLLNCTNYGATLTSDRFGNNNSAYIFNGTNNFLESAQNNLAVGDYYTACAWVKFTEGSANLAVINITQIQPPYSGWELYIRRYDGAIGRYRHPGFIYSSINKVQNGIWTFILIECYRHDTNGYFKICKNNGNMETIFSGNTVESMTVPLNQKINIGRYSGGTHYFGGSIDSVRMYNRLLEDYEKTALYNE